MSGDAITTAEAFAVLDQQDFELIRIADTFGDDAAHEVIEAAIYGKPIADAVADFLREMDDLDVFFDHPASDFLEPLRSAA